MGKRSVESSQSLLKALSETSVPAFCTVINTC